MRSANATGPDPRIKPRQAAGKVAGLVVHMCLGMYGMSCGGLYCERATGKLISFAISLLLLADECQHAQVPPV